MLLVPRQLRRYGMTGDVPYYGGRLTPAHTYAITHPGQPVPPGLGSGQELMAGRAPVPTRTPPTVQAPPTVQTPPPVQTGVDSRSALQLLLTNKVISQAEFDQLQARVLR